MKNFEMRCPFDGTSALQPEFNRVSAAGAIIEFPGSGSQGACAPLQHSHARQVPSAACRARRLGATEMARVLRHGSAAGRLRTCEAVARRSCRMRLLRFRLPQHFHQLLATSERPWILHFCDCAASSPPWRCRSIAFPPRRTLPPCRSMW